MTSSLSHEPEQGNDRWRGPLLFFTVGIALGALIVVLAAFLLGWMG